MNNFEFNSPTRIVFGKDTERNVGDLIRPLGTWETVSLDDKRRASDFEGPRSPLF